MSVLKSLAAELRAASQRLESAQQQLHELAHTDPMTGCFNRRYYDEIIDEAVRRHRRTGQPLTVAFLDIDAVKLVNDTCGHAMGDRLIRHVAQLLRRHVRTDDVVFRWGGDEFVLLLTCSEAAAERTGARLKKALASSVRRWALPPGVGLSIGCAQLGPGHPDMGALINTADERMYADKHGRDPRQAPHLVSATRPSSS